MLGTGEMAQWRKLCKSKDLSLIPGIHVKKKKSKHSSTPVNQGSILSQFESNHEAFVNLHTRGETMFFKSKNILGLYWLIHDYDSRKVCTIPPEA